MSDIITPDSALLPYICPQCDKGFPSRLGLQGHMTTHRPPIPCPECGKEYLTAGALGNHRKTRHGVAPKSGGSERPSGRPKRTAVDPTWKVEDIFTAVLGILYPGGVLPVESLPALLEWREDTKRMLEKVMHG